MKVSGLLVAAVAGLLGFSALSVQAAPVALNLTLSVNTTTKTWSALAQITGDTSQTVGLAGVQFDVVGAGGLVVSASSNKLPSGLDGDNSAAIGYTVKRSNGAANPDGVNTKGYQIAGAQSTNVAVDSGGFTNMIIGLGMTAGSNAENTNAATVSSWLLPAVLATGSYTGSAGSLTIQGKVADSSLLPLLDVNGIAMGISMPASEDGAGIQTFSPDSVLGQTFTLGSVPTPEPASLGLLALGSLMVLRRRRTA